MYPIKAIRRDWYLDHGRKFSDRKLKVRRKQIPLVPAFCITGRSSQGKTMPAVMVDFNIPKHTDPTFGTVVASRVRSREDILILMPFDFKLYNRGTPEGPSLLFQKLRGEISNEDIKKHADAKMPSAQCKQCEQKRVLRQFSDKEWQNAAKGLGAICLTCEKNMTTPNTAPISRASGSAGPMRQCGDCKAEKAEACFPLAPTCTTCIANKKEFDCAACKEVKKRNEFSPITLSLAASRPARAARRRSRTSTIQEDGASAEAATLRTQWLSYPSTFKWTNTGRRDGGQGPELEARATFYRMFAVLGRDAGT